MNDYSSYEIENDQYFIVEANGRVAFERHINYFLDHDYNLIGEPTISPIFNGSKLVYTMYYQAMTKL